MYITRGGEHHLHHGREEGVSCNDVIGGQSLQAKHLGDVAHHLILRKEAHQIWQRLALHLCT